MAEVHTGSIAFIDNVRASTFAQRIEDPGGEREALDASTVENRRMHDQPGRFKDNGSLDLYVPQTTEYNRLETLATDGIDAIYTVVFAEASTVAAGDVARVSQIHLLGNSLRHEPQQRFGAGFSVTDPRHHTLGALRFIDAAVTGAVNGTGFEITGGVPSGKKLVWNIHPWGQSGGASTLVHHLEHDVDNTWAAPTSVALANFTDTGGGGLGGPAIRQEIAATITDTWFRYVVDSVSAGTWKIAVSAKLVTT